MYNVALARRRRGKGTQERHLAWVLDPLPLRFAPAGDDKESDAARASDLPLAGRSSAKHRVGVAGVERCNDERSACITSTASLPVSRSDFATPTPDPSPQGGGGKRGPRES